MGKFEFALIKLIMRLEDDAYGARLHELMEQHESRFINMGQIYTALDRMKDKGFLTSTKGAPTAERGGRSKVIYSVTAEGRKAMRAETTDMASLLAMSPSAGGAR